MTNDGDSTLEERLADIVASKRREAGVPGAAVGLVRDGELAWFLGDGAADLASGQAPTERSLSRVASVTKTFTATAILQLHDRGLLTLDDPLERHLPEFAAVGETGGRRADVTIRRLLTHRSGLVTESPPTRWDGPDGPSFPSMEAILAALPETAVAIPGDSAWKYSNLAFALLGEVVARRAGRPYVEYVRDAIFEPLGMTDARFSPDAAAAAESPASDAAAAAESPAPDEARPMTGYAPPEQPGGEPRVAPIAPLSGLTSAGQLYANVRDLARWVAFQVRGDGLGSDGGPRLLTPESHALSFQPLYVEPDLSAGQCLAWRVSRVGEHVFHNHGGSVHGFNTSVAFHRPSRTGVVVLLNLWPTTAAFELATALLEAAVGGPDARTWDAAAAGGTQLAPPPPAAIIPFLGRYRAEPGIVSTLLWRDGQLRFESEPGTYGLHTPAVVSPIPGGDGAYRFDTGRAAGEAIAFVPGPDGRPETFELGGFTYRRLAS